MLVVSGEACIPNPFPGKAQPDEPIAVEAEVNVETPTTKLTEEGKTATNSGNPSRILTKSRGMDWEEKYCTEAEIKW